MRAIAIVCGLTCLAPVSRGEEKKVIELNSIRLYLPDDVLRQRLGNDVSPLASYIKVLQKEASDFWEKTGQPKAKGLFVVIGVKPDKKSHVWCEAVDGEIPADMLAKIAKRLEEVPAIDVKNGPIAFAIEIKLFDQKPEKFPELPQAWTDAAKKSKLPLVIPDALFKVVWPD